MNRYNIGDKFYISDNHYGVVVKIHQRTGIIQIAWFGNGNNGARLDGYRDNLIQKAIDDGFWKYEPFYKVELPEDLFQI